MMKKGTVSGIIATSLLIAGVAHAQPAASPRSVIDITPASAARVSTQDDHRSFGDYFLEANRGHLLATPSNLSFRRTIAPVRHRLMAPDQFPVAHTAGRLLCENANGPFLLVCRRPDGQRWRSRHYRCTPESETNPLSLFPADCTRHDVWTIENNAVRLPVHPAPSLVAGRRELLDGHGGPIGRASSAQTVRDALNTAARLPSGASGVATALIRTVVLRLDEPPPTVPLAARSRTTTSLPERGAEQAAPRIELPRSPSTIQAPGPQDSRWLQNAVLLGAMILYMILGRIVLRQAKNLDTLQRENQGLKNRLSEVIESPDKDLQAAFQEKEAELRAANERVTRAQAQWKKQQELAQTLRVERDGAIGEARLLARTLTTAEQDLDALRRIQEQRMELIENLEAAALEVAAGLRERERTWVERLKSTEEQAANRWAEQLRLWKRVADSYFDKACARGIALPDPNEMLASLTSLQIHSSGFTPEHTATLIPPPPNGSKNTGSSAPPPRAPSVRPPAAAGYPAGPAGAAPSQGEPRAELAPLRSFAGNEPDTMPYATRVPDAMAVFKAPTQPMDIGDREALLKESRKERTSSRPPPATAPGDDTDVHGWGDLFPEDAPPKG